MKVIGYVRVSANKQDMENQKHLLLQYARTRHLPIDGFIHAKISSRKGPKAPGVDELLAELEQEDVLLVAQLSRLGRNMLQTLNIIDDLNQRGVKIAFVRQPELSTTGPHAKLLVAIYCYLAETERAYFSSRTKQGLAAARANGKRLGRPKGSRNKERLLDPYKGQILDYLEKGLNLAAIMRIINPQLEEPITYNAYRYFVRHEEALLKAWKAQR